MRGLIIGCGSIGERHLFNLKKLGIKDLGIYDADNQKMNKLAIKYNVTKFQNLEAALGEQPDFSIICTPSTSHISVATKCVKSGSHIFIEKPISSNHSKVSDLLKMADNKKLRIAVGYNVRFDDGLNHIKKKIQTNKIGKILSILSQWGNHIKNWNHPNYLNHYILQKGGGIILDDSHEYDYLRWLIDDEVISVYCKTQKLTNLKTKTESLASIILGFKHGAIGTLIIDYVRPRYERTCHIIGEKGDIKWSFTRPNVLKQSYKTTTHSKVISRYLGKENIQEKAFTNQLNQTYILEIKDFLDAIKNNRKPKVDGWEGLKTLEIGLAAHRSAKTGVAIKLI
jgi:predicted dehydrogenase